MGGGKKTKKQTKLGMHSGHNSHTPSLSSPGQSIAMATPQCSIFNNMIGENSRLTVKHSASAYACVCARLHSPQQCPEFNRIASSPQLPGAKKKVLSDQQRVSTRAPLKSPLWNNLFFFYSNMTLSQKYTAHNHSSRDSGLVCEDATGVTSAEPDCRIQHPGHSEWLQDH